MFGTSPLEQRDNDAELIKNLKSQVDELMAESDKSWKLRNDLLDIENKNDLSSVSPENKRYASEAFSYEDRQIILKNTTEKFHEFQETRKSLIEQLETLLNKYKKDPSLMTPSFSEHKEELKFLENKLAEIDSYVKELNETARDEFFSKGAILENGQENHDYYKARNEIDLIKNEKDSTEIAAAFQDQQLDWKEGDLMKQEQAYDEVYKLADIIEKQAKNLTERLESQKVFLAYAKDKNLPIDLKKAMDILDKVEISFAQNIGSIEDIGGDLYKQGLRVKSEDLEPYMKKSPLSTEHVV